MKAIERAVQKVGSQPALAEKVGVTQSLVSQWVSGSTAIHVQHFRAISEAAEGEVTPEELLADEMARHERLAQKRRRSA